MRKGMFSLLAAAFAWSWPNVMIRMLRNDFDVFTQSLFRYVAASIFLFAVGLIFTREKIIHQPSGANFNSPDLLEYFLADQRHLRHLDRLKNFPDNII